CLVLDGKVALVMDPSPVKARVGSDVLLTCLFEVGEHSIDLSYLGLSWSISGQKVAEFADRKRVYREGAELFEDQFRNGNASLLLTNVTVADEGKYTCYILYTPHEDKKDVTLKVQACPTMRIYPLKMIKNQNQTVFCEVVGYYPEPIAIKLLVRGQPIGKSQREPDGTYRLIEAFSFMPQEKDDGVEFGCEVQHESLENRTLERVIIQVVDKKQDGLQQTAVVVISILFTSLIVAGVMAALLHWYDRKKGEPCLFQLGHIQPGGGEVFDGTTRFFNFYPKEIEFKWRCGMQRLEEIPATSEIKVNPDKTYNATSTCRIPQHKLRETGVIIMVAIKHKSMMNPLYKDTTLKDPVFHQHLEVISEPQNWVVGQESTLICSIGGHFPETIQTKWVKRHKGKTTEIQEWSPAQPSKYKIQNVTPSKSKDGYLSLLITSLTFKPSVKEEEGAYFICKFIHEAENIHIEKKSARCSI
uniref:Ig-like domain-containing protein n=1 Tax=Latimeria chalumnae TaxID=7897 RepID=H3A031_LATCH